LDPLRQIGGDLRRWPPQQAGKLHACRAGIVAVGRVLGPPQLELRRLLDPRCANRLLEGARDHLFDCGSHWQVGCWEPSVSSSWRVEPDLHTDTVTRCEGLNCALSTCGSGWASSSL